MKKRSILIVMIISLLLVSGLVSAGFFDQLFGKKLTVKQSEQIAVEKKSNIEAKETISKKTNGYAEDNSLNIKIFYKTIQAPRKPTLYGDFGEEALNFLRIQGTYDNFIVNAKKGIGNHSNKLEIELKSMLNWQAYNASILSRWNIENNQLQSLGDYLVTEEEQELQIKQYGNIIGNGLSNRNVNMSSRAIVINPRQMSSSDRVRLNIPQDVIFEFNNCEDLTDSGVAGSCEKVIHIFSNMSVEGFALMGGDVVRFTSDVWILVEDKEALQEPATGCKDSDGGSDIFKKGKCVDITSKLNEDSCLKTGELKEWSCNNNLCLSNLTSCPKDFSCYMGECIKNQEPEPSKQSWFLKILGRFLG
ncbi:MAG: hypothetical protein KKA65_02230 [Nanoarchaeota archaeon]|nr:hypothetical protein [Nanoarchaeota archaeon]MBU4351480.1 hypothetical protein [Nanoarchaeota archaeon]MBU4456294.1 hypothetical protein [Nanoarchaeota archaeon]MCG2720144.1 hypothetical protein [Nanoarchaeota archaeon]